MTAARARRRPEPVAELVDLDAVPKPPTAVDGIPVVEIRPMPSPRGPNAYFRKRSEVELADGRILAACTVCWFVDADRGVIQGHQMTTHGIGMPYSRKPRPGSVAIEVAEVEEFPSVFDDPAVLSLTLGEILDMAAAVAHSGDMLAAVERRHEEEIAGLRTDMDVLSERYEASVEHWRQRALKAERFKRSVIKRFTALGFNFMADEEA